MDSRTAAHVLTQIAAYLELHGESPFKVRAYQGAAKGVLSFGGDDLRSAFESGQLGNVRGLGPATLAVIRDLVETGESRYLEQLREATPEGLLELMRVPGLGPSKIFTLHRELGIESLEELETAARDGRLNKLPRWGPKTADKILKGIAFLRETGTQQLIYHALPEARRLLALVREHPGVQRAELAGSIRRAREVVRDVDVTAMCAAPEQVIADFMRIAGLKNVVKRNDCAAALHFVDGTRLDLVCARPQQFAIAWWRATGSGDHEALVRDRLGARDLTLIGDDLRDRSGLTLPIENEEALYAAAGLAYVPPELREGLDEVDAASRHALPRLVQLDEIRGVLHCHSNYSDGKATIAEMARAAKERGWSYIGITDHSEAAFYARGLSREQIIAQHAEIDDVNEKLDGVRVLKGIEADILADGRLDYDTEFLSRFDFVIGSIHSRFGMDRASMTQRVLRALDEPHMTILAHPTGRLLLSREPYDIDLDAVFAKAAEVGVAIEHNADPHRLDLDWRHLQRAKQAGVTVEIGPDAHSPHGLDYMHVGIGTARKGWIERSDVLNARSADDVIAFARRRRESQPSTRNA